MQSWQSPGQPLTIKEEILNKLLTFKQDDGDNGRIILVQDDTNRGILEQADDDDAPGIMLEQDEGSDRMHLQENEEGRGNIDEGDAPTRERRRKGEY